MLKHILPWLSASIMSRLCAPDRITGIIALDPVVLDWVSSVAGGSVADQRVRRPTVAGRWLIKDILSSPQLLLDILLLPHKQIIANI